MLFRSGEKMEAIPRNDGEQYRFDAFCKAVLRNEARNYHRNKKRLLDREKSFSVLSLEELGQLTSVDHYPSEEFVFSSYGCDLHIDNELVANAFAALPKQEQSILILFCVLELGDGEIGDLMGMSRSAVQRHRAKTLNELRKKLKAHLPEGNRKLVYILLPFYVFLCMATVYIQAHYLIDALAGLVSA